jgi:hypothetical protein
LTVEGKEGKNPGIPPPVELREAPYLAWGIYIYRIGSVLKSFK